MGATLRVDCWFGVRLDARALGSLAGFPKLRILGFANCRMPFCRDFQAAAAHPRLERLELETSYPALGPSCVAFLGCVYDMLQQGRPDVLELVLAAVQGAGAGRRDSHRFRAALEAVGFALDYGALSDDSDDRVGRVRWAQAGRMCITCSVNNGGSGV